MSRKLWCVFDLEHKKTQIDKLEQESFAEDFWSDTRMAQAQMQQMNALREEVSTWENIDLQLTDLLGLAQLLEDEPDVEMQAEVAQSVVGIEQQVEKLQLSLMLSGEHDERNAIFSIHAGSGGVDAQDWAEMLLRMYLRWAEQHKFRTEIFDYSEGEEAGLKSVTVEITGRHVYGYLRSEAGTHRLIRLSPFDAAHRRHTSFAKVEIFLISRILSRSSFVPKISKLIRIARRVPVAST